ncbi:ATP-binding protein [Streptomyces eurythermus]
MHENEDQPLARRPILSSLAFEGSEPIAEARSETRRFMTDVQAVHGIPVSGRAMGTVQLVVSELVTNAYKYAPGPCLLDLKVSDGAVRISVWDTDPNLPAPAPACSARSTTAAAATGTTERISAHSGSSWASAPARTSRAEATSSTAPALHRAGSAASASVHAATTASSASASTLPGSPVSFMSRPNEIRPRMVVRAHHMMTSAIRSIGTKLTVARSRAARPRHHRLRQVAGTAASP